MTVVLVIGLVSSILAVVIICTATVIFLLYRARCKRKSGSSSSGCPSTWSSTSDFHSPSLPRIPRAIVISEQDGKPTAQYPQLNQRVWKANHTGLFFTIPHSLRSSFSSLTLLQKPHSSATISGKREMVNT